MAREGVGKRQACDAAISMSRILPFLEACTAIVTGTRTAFASVVPSALRPPAVSLSCSYRRLRHGRLRIPINIQTIAFACATPPRMQPYNPLKAYASCSSCEQVILRTGDRAIVEFEFLTQPEFIKAGMKLLFREGKTKVRPPSIHNTFYGSF